MRQPLFVFNWHGGRRFVRDFCIMQIGFFLTGLSISIIINSGLGLVVPWGLLEYAMAESLSIPIGLAFLVITIVAFLVAVLLREPFGWGSAANFIFVTFVWVDVCKNVVPQLVSQSVPRALFAMLAVVTGAFGSAIYLSVGAGPARATAYGWRLHADCA
jgi:uncharacterized membrane protein YczE